MKKYDVIFFDLDGTLTDPQKGLIASFSYALGKMNLPYESKESLKRFIGPPLYETWISEYNLTLEEGAHALDLFREYYSIYGWWDNTPYQGIKDALSKLKAAGKRIILATSKPEIFAKKILHLFDLYQYFDFIGGASTDKTRDRKWEVLEYAIESAGVTDKSSAIMVGDRCYDADGARRVGIDSLGVLYGHGTREELETSGFNYIAATVEEMCNMLL